MKKTAWLLAVCLQLPPTDPVRIAAFDELVRAMATRLVVRRRSQSREREAA